jgi:beta-galactosidase
MFHGGRNPDGLDTTLQESQDTGYPTDLPVKSYDFQAPIGAYGEERGSLRRIKLVNYFLNDFGDLLAPMATRRPDRTPSSPADLRMPRVAARTLGDSGFLFFNNHVRGVVMPNWPAFQMRLKLPHAQMAIPESPINLPSDAYGIWPVNLDLDGIALRYATAQLFKRFVIGEDTFYFFFAMPGIAPEFAFDRSAKPESQSDGVTERLDDKQLLLKINHADSQQIVFSCHGRRTHLVILSRENAERIWKLDRPAALIESSDTVVPRHEAVTLNSAGNATLRFGLFGAEARVAGTTLRRRGRAGLFNQYVVSLTPWAPPGINLTQIQMANTRAQWRWSSKPLWNGKRTALAPEDADFDRAAAWTFRVPTTWASQISNVFLQIQYQGDVARLYNAQHLLDDDFWNGMTWTVGIKDLKMGTQDGRAETWTLRILPLPKSFPMYLENKADLHYPTSGNLASLVSVKVIPQYQCTLLIHKAAPSE